jgi:deoxyribonuclease V
MEELQRELATTAEFEDRPVEPEATEPPLVGAVDQAFLGRNTPTHAVSAAVVYRGETLVDRAVTVTPVERPYIPGLLAFREAGPIVSSLAALDRTPTVLLVDGSGRIHYREAGLATHIGVLYDVPSVGVAKSLLCGEPARPVDALAAGERVPIAGAGRMETTDIVGYAYQSRQYPGSTRINPLYVSPGHRTSAERAVDVVAEQCAGYKLPEPIRVADRLAGARARTLGETPRGSD